MEETKAGMNELFHIDAEDSDATTHLVENKILDLDAQDAYEVP